MKRILYVGLLYHYGMKDKGTSYEHRHIEAGFEQCAEDGMFEVDYYYPDKQEQQLLVHLIPGQYDAIFHVAFNDQWDLPIEAARIALQSDVPIIQFDCDASWRFQDWILSRKDRVSHFVTTHSATVPWYKKHGMNVIKSQWGGSPIYTPGTGVKKVYDTSFLGQKHGDREYWVRFLRYSGIDVHLFGEFWEGFPNINNELLSCGDMIDVFHKSKICLNFSNPSQVGTMPQLKGRHFDIPQAGQFQISTPADNIEEYFERDKEIVVVETIQQMVEKIKYYLEHEDEREAIAKAGHARMLKDHSYKSRLTDIFTQVGVL